MMSLEYQWVLLMVGAGINLLGAFVNVYFAYRQSKREKRKLPSVGL